MENSKTGETLLVDDNKGDQGLMVKAFEALGISNKLIVVDNGYEALIYLKTESEPILVLCDIDMPSMSGIDLRKTIHNNPELKKKCIPFIFITCYENKRNN